MFASANRCCMCLIHAHSCECETGQLQRGPARKRAAGGAQRSLRESSGGSARYRGRDTRTPTEYFDGVLVSRGESMR